MATPKRVKRIDTLSAEQEATFGEWVEKWTAWGLRADQLTDDEWERVANGARASYAFADLEAPAFMVRAASPLGAALSAAVIAELAKDQEPSVGASVRASVGASVRASVGDSVRDSVGASVWASVRASVGDSVRASVRASVGDSVGDSVWASVGDSVGDSVRASVGASVGASVWASVWASVGDSVWASVGDSVWASVGASVGDSVRDSVRASVWASVGASVGDSVWASYDYGNLSAGYMAWLSWFRDVGGLQPNEDFDAKVSAYIDSRIAGPAQWRRGVFAASDLPTLLERDRQGNLHGESGPAIAWRDGWFINSWHGVRVPDDFYEWTIERALSESNSEIRRCAFERLGWDALTDRLTLVAEADDPGNAPHVIRLYDGDLLRGLYAEPARILVVHNASLDKGGHQRTFGLPVPARHSDPVAAAADLFGVPVQAYRDLVRAS